MAKMGENVPHLIDKAIDFIASSQAFREYLNKTPARDTVPNDIPLEHAKMYLARLEYYRQLYQPKLEDKV